MELTLEEDIGKMALSKHICRLIFFGFVRKYTSTDIH